MAVASQCNLASCDFLLEYSSGVVRGEGEERKGGLVTSHRPEGCCCSFVFCSLKENKGGQRQKEGQQKTAGDGIVQVRKGYKERSGKEMRVVNVNALLSIHSFIHSLLCPTPCLFFFLLFSFCYCSKLCIVILTRSLTYIFIFLLFFFFFFFLSASSISFTTLAFTSCFLTHSFNATFIPLHLSIFSRSLPPFSLSWRFLLSHIAPHQLHLLSVQ